MLPFPHGNGDFVHITIHDHLEVIRHSMLIDVQYSYHHAYLWTRVVLDRLRTVGRCWMRVKMPCKPLSNYNKKYRQSHEPRVMSNGYQNKCLKLTCR
jgi:hypothetical protein